MAGGLVHLQGIAEYLVIVARVHPADDGDGHMVQAKLPVQGVHQADQAGGVAGGELQIVGAHAFFIVGIAVEENIRHLVLLAALEDGFLVVLFIDFLVFDAHAAGGRVQDDVCLLHHLLKAAGNGDAEGIKL